MSDPSTVLWSLVCGGCAVWAVSTWLPATRPGRLLGSAMLGISRPDHPTGDPLDHRARQWRRAGSAGAGLAVWLLLGGLVGAGAGLVAAGAAWWLTGRMEPAGERRRREQLEAETPHVVDLLAACLSVGTAPLTALEEIAGATSPVMATELRALVRGVQLAAPGVDAWRPLASHPQLGPVGRSLSRAVESGASVADALERLADDLRRDQRAVLEGRARTVGVTSALPLGLCLLPAFVLVGVVPLVVSAVPPLLQP